MNRIKKRKLKEKKIIVFSFGRSDFGILRGLVKKLKKKNKLDLIATGAHNSEIFGNTFTEIQQQKINFKKIIINYEKNSKNKTGQVFSEILFKINNFLIKKKYNYTIILGDRYEALAAAIICFQLGIKIIHIGGGSLTTGSRDQIYRNCISQLAQLHLVETSLHKKQLAKLNINKNVFVVGSLALNNIKYKKTLDKENFQKKLNIKFVKNKKIFISTFHPDTTISLEKNLKNLNILIKFLIKRNENVLFTYPNADEGFREYIKLIKKLNNFKNFFLIKNLGQEMYFSALKFSNFLIGNSSSGIIEAPSFRIPILNLGNRQGKRFRSKTVINSEFNINKINKKFKYINSKSYLSLIKKIKNIYEKKDSLNAGVRIINKFINAN